MTDFDGVREQLQGHIDEHGFLAWLNASVESVGPGRLVLRIPYDERLTNPSASGPGGRATVHGGVAATLIDTAGGVSIRTTMPDPLDAGVATIDLNVSYLRPSTAALVATAETVRVGNTVGVATVSVEAVPTEDDRTEVAVGRGSYRVFRNRAE